MPEKDTYRDCEFCNDVIAFGVDSRVKNSKPYHVDCFILMLKDKIHKQAEALDMAEYALQFITKRWCECPTDHNGRKQHRPMCVVLAAINGLENVKVKLGRV